MDNFLKIADSVVIYHIKTVWLEIEKMYNKVAAEKGGSLAMGFALLAIDKLGTPVTKIAPRLGLEPNSLSRLLKSMEKKALIYKRKDEVDKRRVYICLTEKGIEMQQFAMEMVFGLEKVLHDDISAEKLAIFFEVMRKIPTSVGRFKEEVK
ncbi:MAG: MarR family winged helix-turn-helix transcriptional regulator [Chitinophagales bacterium]